MADSADDGPGVSNNILLLSGAQGIPRALAARSAIGSAVRVHALRTCRLHVSCQFDFTHTPFRTEQFV